MKFIYILPEYANSKHLENVPTRTTDEYTISYTEKDSYVELTETNSKIGDEYSLNFKSAKYSVTAVPDPKGGLLESTEVKESMIHHHTKGHKSRHLQFKLQSQRETIRIFLDNLDDDDYIRCIKGFLHITQDLIIKEQEENKIKENLIKYFFNEKIKELASDRKYLLGKINEAFAQGQITDMKDKSVDKQKLLVLKKDLQLEPFLELTE